MPSEVGWYLFALLSHRDVLGPLGDPVCSCSRHAARTC